MNLQRSYRSFEVGKRWARTAASEEIDQACDFLDRPTRLLIPRQLAETVKQNHVPLTETTAFCHGVFIGSIR